mmetsp:Transcript_14187/g.43894  ORF Transcript_14187/g.43894 Transcript_14187/m.43894 type:complete len:374 (-) Transcript_14187:234-1355(-)
MQRPAARDREGVARVLGLDLQRDVSVQLLEEAVPDDAARELVALFSGQRRLVDRERHGHGGLLDLEGGERRGGALVDDRLADLDVGDAGEHDDLARARLGDFLPAEVVVDEEVVDFDVAHLAVGAVHRRERAAVVRLEAALADAPDAQLALKVVVVDVRHQQLRGRLLVDDGRRDAADDGVEDRRHRLLELVGLDARLAVDRRAVDDVEVRLLVRRVELDEEVERLVDDVLGPRLGPVDLVYHEDGFQPQLQRLLEHEARLRLRALDRVDDEQHAVDHVQDALDLAAEVRVARRVDEVDLDALVVDGRVFREDRDAALALLVVAVHDALLDLLVLPEHLCLLQQRVDERRLAVVDVRHDGDVADTLQRLRRHA